MTKKNQIHSVIFCYTCGVDIRQANRRLHEKELGHEVKELLKDPRDVPACCDPLRFKKIY